MTQNKNWIAYVGPFQFPWGQPGSRRVYGIARSLAEVGYSVVVGSGEAAPATPERLNEDELISKISYLGLNEMPVKGSSLLDKSLQIFIKWGKNTLDWLDSQSNKPSYVIVYGGSAQYMYRLLPWCKINKIPLIVDVVEWHNPKYMPGGFFGPFHISAGIAIRYFYPKCDGVITISSYLSNYYAGLGCKVIKIPPTFDVKGYKLYAQERQESTYLTLVYAGTPGKKDLLANVIQGIERIDAKGDRIKLIVIGPSLHQVKQLLGNFSIPIFVEILGQIPQQEVFRIIQEADFSVLLREPFTLAQAGFPTKFVESMSNGTPVIANLTSDLDQHLHDGINGIICYDHSVTSFAEALQRTLLLTAMEIQEMRIKAREHAESFFDFRNYIEPLSIFLNEIKK